METLVDQTQPGSERGVQCSFFLDECILFTSFIGTNTEGNCPIYLCRVTVSCPAASGNSCPGP